MFITEDIKYVGVDDHEVDLFESQYIVPNGMAYNSYVIMDEKIAVMDTVDGNFKQEWMDKVIAVLDGRKPDYLVVQHMEPDHSANIKYFMETYSEAIVVSSAQAFKMMQNFFGTDFVERRTVVGEGDTLSLGKHMLNFVTAPMVHWPEVIVTYDSTDKVLFSADGFGKFGALDIEEDWACEARRYYFNIVGKYGSAVQTLLKKAAGLEIEKILPLHGPILEENLGYYLGLYDTWSSYKPEKKGVFIAHASVHGNTKKAAEALAEKIRGLGEEKVVVSDLCREDTAECVEDAFKYDRMILCAATYDGGAFVPMEDFLHHLQIKTYQNRTVGLLENGSWAPMAARAMRGYLDSMKNIKVLDEVATIKSALKAEDEETLDKLARAIVEAGDEIMGA